MKTKYIHYYVEGEDEKKVIDVLKTDLRAIKPGKVTLLNPVAQEIKDMHLRPLTAGTMVYSLFTSSNRQTMVPTRSSAAKARAMPTVQISR